MSHLCYWLKLGPKIILGLAPLHNSKSYRFGKALEYTHLHRNKLAADYAYIDSQMGGPCLSASWGPRCSYVRVQAGRPCRHRVQALVGFSVNSFKVLGL